jgi:hypothetical protein
MTGTPDLFVSPTSSFIIEIPGLARPMAFNSPQGTSTIVGPGFPLRGLRLEDFVTTAPAPASTTRFNVPPDTPRKPDASIVGLRSFSPAISVESLDNDSHQAPIAMHDMKSFDY